LAWIAVALVGQLFMKAVKITVAGGFDRLAGAALGFLKAGLLIVIVHMILGATLPATNGLTRGCVTCPALDQTSNFCRLFISDPKTRDAFMHKALAIPIEAIKHDLNGVKPSGEAPAQPSPATPPSAHPATGAEPADAGGLAPAKKPGAGR